MNDVNLSLANEKSVSLLKTPHFFDSHSQLNSMQELCWVIPTDGNPFENKLLNGKQIECLCIQLNPNDQNNKPIYVFIPLVDLFYKTSYTEKNLKKEISNLISRQSKLDNLTIKQRNAFYENELVKAINEVCKKQGLCHGVSQVAQKALNKGLNVIQKEDGIYGHGRVTEVQTATGKAIYTVLDWLKTKKNNNKNHLVQSSDPKEKSELKQTIKDKELKAKKLSNSYKELEYNRALFVSKKPLPLLKRRFNYLSKNKRKHNERVKVKNKIKELELLNAARIKRFEQFNIKIIQSKDEWVKDEYKNEEIFNIKIAHFNKRKVELLKLIEEDEKLISTLKFKLSDIKIHYGYGYKVTEFFNKIKACAKKLFSCCTSMDDEDEEQDKLSMSYSRMPSESYMRGKSLNRNGILKKSKSTSQIDEISPKTAVSYSSRVSESEVKSKREEDGYIELDGVDTSLATPFMHDELKTFSKRYPIIEGFVKEGAFLDLIQIIFEFLKLYQKHKEASAHHIELLGKEYNESIENIRMQLTKYCENCLTNLVSLMNGKKEFITDKVENQVKEINKILLKLNNKSGYDQDEELIFSFIEYIRENIKFDLQHDILIHRLEVLKNVKKLLAFENVNFDEDLTSKNSESLLKAEMNEFSELYQIAKQIRKTEATNLSLPEIELIQRVEQRLRVAIAVRNTKIKNLDADKILRGMV